MTKRVVGIVVQRFRISQITFEIHSFPFELYRFSLSLATYCIHQELLPKTVGDSYDISHKHAHFISSIFIGNKKKKVDDYALFGYDAPLADGRFF